MKQEFMLYIRNEGDAKAAMTAAQHLEFVKKCEVYIKRLQEADQLIAAQPLLHSGWLLSKSKTGWKSTAIDPAKEIQVGYYHIRAYDLEEAIAIAKDNPEFEYVPSATIEVRPVKIKEEETGFEYPENE
ncbi:YciI family protein [Chitinophaga sp. HK235]|uniref:YciI family protein n=1 Tax=Chitinophaga sp. HK235 TaxID=2952571 RepID=UPI001BAAA4B5|nr:YciI family protein [Chitinophaga sp. HK235]